MSGAVWSEAFLEMMAVERAAARNTLTAYGKDLQDASGFLVSKGQGLDDASAEHIEAYFQAKLRLFTDILPNSGTAQDAPKPELNE